MDNNIFQTEVLERLDKIIQLLESQADVKDYEIYPCDWRKEAEIGKIAEYGQGNAGSEFYKH